MVLNKDTLPVLLIKQFLNFIKMQKALKMYLGEFLLTLCTGKS